MSGFSFRGIHSRGFGIFTQDANRVLLPPRREGRSIIPGRSGYYDGISDGVYDERVEGLLCSFVCPAGSTVPQVCRAIARWLSGSGRLVYDTEPDKYYLARLSGAPPQVQHFRHGEFTLTFSINPPFAFGRTVTAPIHAGVNPVAYEGTAETPCTIVLKNISTADVVNVTITAVKRSV